MGGPVRLLSQTRLIPRSPDGDNNTKHEDCMCSKDNLRHGNNTFQSAEACLIDSVYNIYNVPVSMVTRSAYKMKHKESDGGSFARL